MRIRIYILIDDVKLKLKKFLKLNISEDAWNINENANSMWKKMTIHIRKVVVEVFGVIKANKRELKDT
jgi:hypothetical protein